MGFPFSYLERKHMKISYRYFTKRGSPPRGYRFSYSDYMRAFDIFYPIPFNLVVRYWRKLYWGFIRDAYRVGLVDTKMECEFRWDDFFRIKSH